MSCILVSGLINIETLRVDSFPIPYTPVRYPFHGVDLTASGVEYNIAKALTKLDNDVWVLSIIGQDAAAVQIRAELSQDNMPDTFVLSKTKETARSVILYDKTGKRQIHVDLNDIQDECYPLDLFHHACSDCDLVSLCNINFSRPMLKRAIDAGKLIATDVHTISNNYDEYNQDFMKATQILFMSAEALTVTPEDWVQQVIGVYGTDTVIIGLGRQGALLSVRSENFLERIPAVQTRPIVNTIGAGDALFSAFIHAYARSQNPYESIHKAILFASYKIWEKGAAEGFLNLKELEDLYPTNKVSYEN